MSKNEKDEKIIKWKKFKENQKIKGFNRILKNFKKIKNFKEFERILKKILTKEKNKCIILVVSD